MSKVDRDFPVARIGSGSVVHYVDNYRYEPGRTLCGRALNSTDEVLIASDITEAPSGPRLCSVCAKIDYPTREEFEAYMLCTDCEGDRRGEDLFQIRPSVWEIAYPGYNTQGIGVGTSRPCIGCLERRLGRQLVGSDFTQGQAPNPSFSERLNLRLADPR